MNAAWHQDAIQWWAERARWTRNYLRKRTPTGYGMMMLHQACIIAYHVGRREAAKQRRATA